MKGFCAPRLELVFALSYGFAPDSVPLCTVLLSHRSGEWGDHVTLQAAADKVLTAVLEGMG